MKKTRTEAAIRGLYAVTPDEPDTARLCTLVAAAVSGGARLVQYRNKTASDALRMAQASALLAVCRRHNVPLIINDHIELAAQIGADGLHVGRDDGDAAAARARLPHALIGRSRLGDHFVQQRRELDQRQLIGEPEGPVLGAQLR